MASRTRNRVLGIAALVGLTALAVVVVLLSQGGDKPRVAPLREEAANHERLGKPSQSLTPPGWRLTPDPSSRTEARRKAKSRTRKQKSSARRGDRRPARAKEKKTTRRARSRKRRAPRTPAAQPRPVSVPAPGHTPTPPSTPSPTSEPVSTQPAATQPGSTPKADATPEGRPPVEILLTEGELESESDRVRSHDGHMRLRIRSDRFVIVEVEDRALSWPILAGGEALISFDTGSVKSYELELRRHKGVLVLRLDD